MKYEDKSNNELLQIRNNLRIEHEDLKQKMLKLLDKIEDVEATFNLVDKIIFNRSSGV